MTLPLKGSIPLDDTQLEKVHTGTYADITEDLKAKLEHEHGRGDITTIYDGARSLNYEFTVFEGPAKGGTSKEEPPYNQVDASELKDPDSLVANMYKDAPIDKSEET